MMMTIFIDIPAATGTGSGGLLSGSAIGPSSSRNSDDSLEVCNGYAIALTVTRMPHQPEQPIWRSNAFTYSSEAMCDPARDLTMSIK
jgi:hypothetical protein